MNDSEEAFGLNKADQSKFPRLEVVQLLSCSVFGNWVAAANIFLVGGSPGLVVMGGDSHSKGRGFEYRYRILDGHDIFSH